MKERHYSVIIRELREDHDYRQKEIAAVLGIDQRVYSRYETAVSAMPVHHLIKLCRFYGVSMDYVVGLSGEKGKTCVK
ncbi:MAG: helix-turn-helix domain-containing protein [Lachnospiraceae bacterium]|nr:helix-turn-helix domain-containing protein [Lachnospiraceae bacterium]